MCSSASCWNICRTPLVRCTGGGAFLRPGGSITAIEGDHGSCYFHPEVPEALQAWRCLIDVQAHLQGDSLIGRRLYPLLRDAGFADVHVSPRMVYTDDSRPGLVEAFVRRIIIPMVEGVEQEALRRCRWTSRVGTAGSRGCIRPPRPMARSAIRSSRRRLQVRAAATAGRVAVAVDLWPPVPGIGADLITGH